MHRETSTITIDVAIVNWNTADAALNAARAYLASKDVEARVTIADNASNAAQRALLERECPTGVALELNEENHGYGTAANLALRGGTAELVCISNADVLAEPGALAALAQATLEESVSGMVGPSFGGETDRYHASLPGPTTMLGRIFVGSFLRGAVPAPSPGGVKRVDQPSGACFMMRRETWEKVRGFDEGFFLWYEDVDLAKRLCDAGYQNFVTGSARVGHVGARSFLQLDRRRLQAIRLASVERYIHKHHHVATHMAAPLLRLSRWLRADGTLGDNRSEHKEAVERG